MDEGKMKDIVWRNIDLSQSVEWIENPDVYYEKKFYSEEQVDE